MPTLTFKVTHAQRRYDKPDDAPVVTEVRVHDAREPGALYITSRPHGCSRNFTVPAEVAIRRWLTDEHSQTVLAIDPA